MAVMPDRSAPAVRALGHTGLLHALGAVGDVPPPLMPWLLRLSAVLARTTGGDSKQLLEVRVGLRRLCFRPALSHALACTVHTTRSSNGFIVFSCYRIAVGCGQLGSIMLV